VKFRITHSTRYEYEESIPLSHNVVRLRPWDFSLQTCLRHELHVIPAPRRKRLASTISETT
jgi:hypothetical protein